MSDPAAPSSQIWDAAIYAHHAGFVPDLGLAVVDLLDPQPGEQILDLGCGDGVLSQELVRRGARVFGVDASPAMVEAAQQRGIDARIGDGTNLPAEGPFDAVFSNAALHWMTEPDRVLAEVYRVLRVGGRFVGEMGADGNIKAITTALVDVLEQRGYPAIAVWPWYFPTIDDYRSRLEVAGFRLAAINRFERPTPLPTGLTGWLRTFAGPFLATVPSARQDELIAEVAAVLTSTLRDSGGGWQADYVRLRFAAVKPPR